eukprot:m.143719 g.143719  ORF g.143719 m.143719 type:complete len:359 (-) comp14904_c0_seq11:1924-3000(-)
MKNLILSTFGFAGALVLLFVSFYPFQEIDNYNPNSRAKRDVTESHLTGIKIEEPEASDIVDKGVTDVPTPKQPSITRDQDFVYIEKDPFDTADADPTGTLGSTQPPPPILQAVKGIEILAELGIPYPTLAFDYDNSDEAKQKRMDAKKAEFMAEGMPEAPSLLRAQLYERELVGKKNRAEHNIKRTAVRMIQEARLKKDAEDRDMRLSMLKLKQEQVVKEMQAAEEARREAEEEKEKERKEREEKVEAERLRIQNEKEMMRKIRLEEVERLQSENEKRRLTEKEEKKKEIKLREEQGRQDAEAKRKMLEEYQSLMQAQLEDQKRLAREERLKEAQEARESRLRMEEKLGLNKKLTLND